MVTLASNQFEQADYSKLISEAEVVEDQDQLKLIYPLSEKAVSLETLRQDGGSTLEKLKLAQTLSGLTDLEGDFKIPFLHPENVMLEGGQARVVHFGLRTIFEPKQMTENNFFSLYRGLILSIFNPKNDFANLLSGVKTNRNAINDQIIQTETVDELINFINELTENEMQKVQSKQLMVKKTNYRFFKYFGIFSVLAAMVMGAITYSYYSQGQKQEAVISAQSYFLNQNYDKTQSVLKKYSPNSLPVSARYVLAASSVNLTDLTSKQKETILNNLSTKSDNNTLDYWINTGRGQFDKALNLAQNLGDNQLTLLAYTNLYESTKLNSTMNGEEKQKKLDNYSKKIKELTGQLEK